MKPIALLMNDLHITKDNTLDYERNWNEALSVCERYSIKKMFIGGDIFTTRSAQSLYPLLIVYQCFHKAVDRGIEVNVAFGNHDCPAYGEQRNWLDLYSDIVNVGRTWTYFEMGEKVLAMCSYYPEDTMMAGMLRELNSWLSKHDYSLSDAVVYLHSGVHGALGDFDVPNEIPQGLLTSYFRVLCGHYHNRTVIADTNIEYIGSSRAHNFGEDDRKGYTLLYPNGETLFIQNEANIRYATDDVTLDELDSWKKTHDDRYKVRLRIHCNASEVDTIDRDDLMERGADKIEFMTEKIQAIKVEQSKIEETFDNKNLQLEYKSFCKEKDIDSRFGIDYLNKK